MIWRLWVQSPVSELFILLFSVNDGRIWPRFGRKWWIIENSIILFACFMISVSQDYWLDSWFWPNVSGFLDQSLCFLKAEFTLATRRSTKFNFSVILLQRKTKQLKNNSSSDRLVTFSKLIQCHFLFFDFQILFSYEIIPVEKKKKIQWKCSTCGHTLSHLQNIVKCKLGKHLKEELHQKYSWFVYDFLSKFE